MSSEDSRSFTLPEEPMKRISGERKHDHIFINERLRRICDQDFVLQRCHECGTERVFELPAGESGEVENAH